MEGYKRWVREKKEYVHSFETLSTGLMWVPPELFSNSEIVPEAVTTILGIITTINAHIIETAPTQDITGSTESYSFPYSLFLSVLAGLESLVEGVAQHYYGDNKKWNFLVVTEATKVLVRLSLFRKSGYKMLLSGMETSNDDTNSISLTSQDQSSLIRFGEMEPMTSNRVDQNHQREIAAECTMLSTCRVDQNHHQEAIIDPPVSVTERPTLFDILSKKGLCGVLCFIGEVLFITRPLVSVLFIRKYSIRSWTPWFLSLAFDCIGMSILSLVATSVAGRKERRIYLSASEKDEVKRRKLLFVLYILKDPFFSKYTRQKLESIEKVLEPVPVIGFLTAKAVELIIGCQTRYTYISGS
ncbi:putative peroxisome membrane protein, Pex16 [Lupinus albus]|uniref:Peroxisomal membrane protein PEX16 n=1 Tax=Lupinus albus TaxID=3870 RepID=A0A6A4RA56_LUPAL|nr:putative peroxisome membrane protein, Pex16 [Lupinus albus]